MTLSPPLGRLAALRTHARLAGAMLRMERVRILLLFAAVVAVAAAILFGRALAVPEPAALADAGLVTAQFALIGLLLVGQLFLGLWFGYLGLEAFSMRMSVAEMVRQVPAAVLLDEFHTRIALRR